MEKYISINEASSIYGKSVSTIKRVLKTAKHTDLKKGDRLNTGLYKTLISVSFLNSHFKPIEGTTENNSNREYIDTLKNQLTNQQKTIDKLLQNQEQLIENERNFQILLERANQRAELLEQHYKRNKSLGADIIEEVEENEEEFRGEEIPTDRGTFNEWLKGYKKTPNQ